MAVLTNRPVETIRSVEQLRSKPAPTQEQIDAYVRAHEQVQQTLAAAGIDPEDLIADFDRWQSEQRSQAQGTR